MKTRLRLTKKKRRGMRLCTGGTEEGGHRRPPSLLRTPPPPSSTQGQVQDPSREKAGKCQAYRETQGWEYFPFPSKVISIVTKTVKGKSMLQRKLFPLDSTLSLHQQIQKHNDMRKEKWFKKPHSFFNRLNIYVKQQVISTLYRELNSRR